MIIVSITNVTWLCIMLYQLLNNIFFSFSNWGNSYLSILVQNARNNNFLSCYPTLFSVSFCAGCRLLTFYFPSKCFGTLFLNTQQLANNPKNFFNCFITYLSYKFQPINKNTQNKIFQKFPFFFIRYSKRISNIFKSICMSTFVTLKSAIFALQYQLRATFQSLYHRNIFYKIFWYVFIGYYQKLKNEKFKDKIKHC
jgi:hypothetical protein